MEDLPTPNELRHITEAALDEVLRTTSDQEDEQQLSVRMLPVCQQFQIHTIQHFHAIPEIFVPLLGEGALVYEEGQHRLSYGHAVVVPRGVAHEEEIFTRPYRNLVFTCAENRLHFHLGVEKSAPHKGRARVQVTLQDERARRVTAHLNEATSYRAGGRNDDHPLVSGLLLTSIALMREIVVEANSPTSTDPLVEQARHLILTHMTSLDLSVGWMAMRLDCNPDYLSNRFHAVTGGTISNAIANHRLNFACRRLQETIEPIGIIARSAGFRDPAYFSRVFRDYYGQSPRSWRRSQAGS